MPKIKTDVSGVDEAEAKAFGAGSGESPKPGIYRAKVLTCTPGYAKGDDGDADKKRPRLEITYAIQGGEFNGSQLWDYIILPAHDSFGDAAKKRMFQFVRAVGQKPGESLDTDKAEGKLVRVRVRSGTKQDGSYRGEFSAVFKDSDSEAKLGAHATGTPAKGPFDGDSSDEELLDGETGTDEITDDTVSDETDWDARLVELNAMSVADLKEVAREWKSAGWDLTIGGKKSDVAAAVLEVEKSAAEQADAGDDEQIIEDGDDEILTDDDEELLDDVTDTAEYLTEDQLKAMSASDLVKLAKDDFDIDAKAQGLKTKNALVAAVLEAQAAPGADEPF